ncbi:hypothetical protein U14_03568 [Candidatus Moduliflexus flocculans]|uniref:DUF218 domain-containing protein n=1 Tax=Candidatus Moduliflexus flocculans TaxID=1499966 RepID=A0A081BPK1_9BACT|nr:hypothetical protein U14_03568 [Candidatus Moduliflexus flocculans]
MNVGIVCGYGIVADERLVAYVRCVIEYASAHQLDTLILCGGQTIREEKRTEAETLREIMGDDVVRFHLLMEETSISTLHNLLYSRQLIETRRLPVKSVTIFCDTLRFMKVFCLTKLLFHAYSAQVVSFQRKEPLFMYALQLPFTLLQCVGAVCPPFERLLLRCRKLAAKSQQTR